MATPLEAGRRAAFLPLVIEKGTNNALILGLQDNAGQVLNLAGTTLSGGVARQYGTAELAAFEVELISNQFHVKPGPVADLPAGPEETSPASQYVYDLFWVDASGQRWRVLYGPLALLEKATDLA